MQTTALRLYGKLDLRLETFDLPDISDGEILIRIITDSVCMSTYKTAMQGADHVRVRKDLADHPVILGHEFCAEIVQVGRKWQTDYRIGEKVIVPPALTYLNRTAAIGYCFCELGGDATYGIIYEHIIEHGYLMKLESEAFFGGSLIEPVSCVLRGYKASYHLDEHYNFIPGIREGGKLAILAGCGPMGLAAIDCALHGDRRPSLLVVTDVNPERLARAARIFDPAQAAREGIQLIFSASTDREELLALTGGSGFDDVLVYAPVPAVVELGDRLLAFDGCLNFFAGPTDKQFSAKFNFYDVHYAQHHLVGTSGSNPDDIRDVVRLIGEKRIDPAFMITHIGGLDAAMDATLRLPQIPGGKKLIYNQIRLPLIAIDDFEALGVEDPRFARLAELVQRSNGLWCVEAEQYLLQNF